MALEYVKVAQYEKDFSCPNNEAVVCDVKKCKVCGWNPIVAKKRLDRVKRMRAEV